MKEINLEHIKSKWQTESNNISTGKTLSESEIRTFLSGKSQDISRIFKTGLYFDITFKLLLTSAFLVMLYLWHDLESMHSTIVGLMSLCGIQAAIQRMYLKKLPRFDNSKVSSRDIIVSKTEYYHKTYKKSIFIAASSSPLFFICGSMYYFLSKYGEIRSFDAMDFVVLGSGIIIAYLISLFSQLYQFKFHINQMEKCVREIDEEEFTELSMKQIKNKRLRNALIMILLFVAGTLLFTFLLAN